MFPKMRMDALSCRVSLAVLALIAAIAVPLSTCQPEPGAGGQVTRLRVTDRVEVASVKRLGINLGSQDFYDAGQMTKNLLFRNPGFEGMSYRTILHCDVGGAGSCVDKRQGVKFPADFWTGAAFEILDGIAAGRRGKVIASEPVSGPDGCALGLEGKGTPIAAGDWLAVAKEFPGDPALGWWPTLKGGAVLKAERVDLSPATQGRQALRVEASGSGQTAQIKSYFDTTEGRTFLRLRGRFRLSFRAKSLGGFKVLHVRVARVVPNALSYLEQDVKIAGGWADYHQDFAANEAAGPAAPVEVSLTVAGGDMLLDDVDLEPLNGDPDNRTAFRDEVLQTLRELRPGILRMMSTNAGLGSTVDDLLAPPMARRRAGFSAWFNAPEDIPVGIPEVLELCRAIGAEPWIVAPTVMSREEARKLAEYLAGGAETPGGALRAAAGRPAPWTEAFPAIHVELGNETWNGIFQGEAMVDPAAYGRRANAVFAAMRGVPGANDARLDLVVGAQAAWPGRNAALLAAAPLANTLAIAPYLMHSVTRWSTDDELYGPLLAQPEQMSREGLVQAAQGSARGRRLAVYEVNLHTTEGSAPQAVLDHFTPSTAAGVAVAGHMLRMMRDHAVRDQMLYSLPQFQFKRADGIFVRLWGSVVTTGTDGRRRPQFLAESLANRAIAGNMMHIDVGGEDPTHDQPEGNDGVRLRDVHEIDAYAFQQGARHSLVVFNYGLHQARQVHVEAPGLARAAQVKLWRLSSPGPGATNEESINVRVEEDRHAGPDLLLQPCSIAVLEWTE
jgi:hypothetical protein